MCDTPESGFVRYYEVPPARNYPLTDIDHTTALVRTTLGQSVSKRLLADWQIHVGAFCGDGLDSSLIAVIAAREWSKAVKLGAPPIDPLIVAS